MDSDFDVVAPGGSPGPLVTGPTRTAGRSQCRDLDRADDVTVTVRRATLPDADQIAGLLCQLGYPSTAPDVEKRLTFWFDDPFSAVLAAEHSGRVVGSFPCTPSRTSRKPGAGPASRASSSTRRPAAQERAAG